MIRLPLKTAAWLLGLILLPAAAPALRAQAVETAPTTGTSGNISLSWRPVFLSDDRSDFVVVTDVAPDIMQEIRYFSTYNFVGERIDGYLEPVALLTREAAEALKKASDILVRQGYRLKIFDAYRPQMAVDHFKRWAKKQDDTRMKPYFYPDVDKSQLFSRGYVASHSGHSRGSTLDLTILEMATGKEVDMGGPFDFLGPRSHVDCPDITERQHENRMILRRAMVQAGFRPYEKEWWHFTLRNEPFPYTYFTFPVSTFR